MLKVGITGGIASGKSTVCELFSHYNVPIIDADVIARELVEPNQPAFTEIVSTFGASILNNDGLLNRQALRTLIFSDPESKQALENILHPRIRQQLVIRSSSLNVDYCLMAIPLLVESHWQEDVDRVLLVDIEAQSQLKRLHLRDQISNSEAQSIIDSQCSQAQRLAVADDVINNDKPIDCLQKTVSELDQKYRELAKLPSTYCQRSNSQRQ